MESVARLWDAEGAEMVRGSVRRSECGGVVRRSVVNRGRGCAIILSEIFRALLDAFLVARAGSPRAKNVSSDWFKIERAGELCGGLLSPSQAPPSRMALRISSLQPLLRRHAGTEAISRLQLDINAHHHADQQSSPRDPAPPLSKSSSAQRGESLRGDVTLPRELLDAVDLAIAGPSFPLLSSLFLTSSTEADDNPALRISALDLYAHLRSTAPILPAPSSYRDRQALSTTYDAPTSLAYLAGLMPSIYGATLHALTMTRDRLAVLGEWEPERMVDWGSGTGSAAWAFGEVWGGGGRTYVGLDASKAMVELSSSILGALPNRIGEGKLEGRAYQLAVPASDSALAKLQLGRKTSVPEVEGGKRTVAIAAFSLGDLGTKERRKDVVRCMWESGAEVLVVVERGTPGGSRMVLEAREQLLGYGRRSLGREETVEGEIGPEKGCFVLAPVSRAAFEMGQELMPSRSAHTMATALCITRPSPTATFRNEVRIPLSQPRSQRLRFFAQFAPLLSSAIPNIRLEERTTPSSPTSSFVAVSVPPVAHPNPFPRRRTPSRPPSSRSLPRWTLRSRSKIRQKGTS